MTKRDAYGSALVVSWALLLAARHIAAATLNAGLHGMTFSEALEQMGLLLPACAWVSLASGIALLLSSGKSDHPKKGPEVNGQG